MAWLNLTMPNQTVKNGLKAKKIKLPQMNFFLKKQLILFKKILRAHPELRDVPFSDPKWSICPEQIFLVQTIIITFICLLALFIMQNLKKFLLRIQSYEDVSFLGPKWSICPNFFSGKLLKSFSSTF